MDKSAIRNFSIEARKILMRSAETEAGFYGVTRKGCKSPIQKGNDFEVYETLAGTENRIYGADIKKRANLVEAVETLGFDQVIEETAYTWFNRIIAIRFMEVNGYLPTRVRVLSSEKGSNTPDIVTQSLDVDLNMTPEELEKVQKAKDENRYDDAFRMLFVKQCNELNTILPGLFETTDDYMELLLKLSYTNDGVVRMLVDTISEDDFNVETEGQIQIIGWMYQYYNTDLKKETYDLLNDEVKVTKERIPSVTQLFTPDWIVRYLVENTLGRLWIRHLKANDNNIDEIQVSRDFGWKYYLPTAEQSESTMETIENQYDLYKNIDISTISCLDPCMGSGHILVYMFDVLMDIYMSIGFSKKDAADSILMNNIYGLDIDKRAYQLSYFAIIMKARSYNKLLFRRKLNDESAINNVFAVKESNHVSKSQIELFGNMFEVSKQSEAKSQIYQLLDELKNAKEIGSLTRVSSYDWDLMIEYIDATDITGQISFETWNIDKTKSQLLQLIELGKVLSKKYNVVITNPPYMGINNMGGYFYNYVIDNYPDFKHDIYCVFIERGREFLDTLGFEGMITQQSFMFNSRYVKARKSIINSFYCENLLHLGSRAFDEISGEKVQTCAYVFGNRYFPEYETVFVDLQEGTSENEKENMFLNIISGKTNSNLYYEKMANFLRIGNYNFSYWLSEAIINVLNHEQKISTFSDTRHGLVTGKGDTFMRFWNEVNLSKFISNCVKGSEECKIYKWFPYNKGGSYRKWYGNREYVINWENNGFAIQNFKDDKGKIKSSNYNLEYNLMPNISWSDLSTGKFSARFTPAGSLFDTSGPAMFTKDERKQWYTLAFTNSIVMQKLLDIYCIGLHYSSGAVGSIPLIFADNYFERIVELAKENVELAKEDWDSSEMSWEFKKHPLIRNVNTIEEAFYIWEEECKLRFNKVKENEMELNILFAQIYELSKEIEINITDEDITLHIANISTDIKSFISYSVGCMMGRYSLDKEGVCFAGSKWDDDNYTKFIPNRDGIIPITDDAYLKEDIVTLFINFVQMVYGEENLEKNLDFIANIVSKKGNSSREKIRNYFVEKFFEDHCSVYSLATSGKRPIYWMFDSGKQNGFKCLVYMHRYTKDTLNLIRSEYLYKIEDAIGSALKNAEYITQTSSSAVERAKATKDKDKFIKKLNEMRIYYQALSHLAIQKIEIDLDDGVKNNYQLFQGIEVIADGGKKQKVDLLAKI